jgi:hypothetical protein
MALLHRDQQFKHTRAISLQINHELREHAEHMVEFGLPRPERLHQLQKLLVRHNASTQIRQFGCPANVPCIDFLHKVMAARIAARPLSEVDQQSEKLHVFVYEPDIVPCYLFNTVGHVHPRFVP